MNDFSYSKNNDYCDYIQQLNNFNGA